MSEKGRHSRQSREERLAAELRANLRRRKQAARKAAASSEEISNDPDHDADKSVP